MSISTQETFILTPKGLQTDTHGEGEQRSDNFDPSNPHARPLVSPEPNSANMIYTQNEAQLKNTFGNIAQQMVHLNVDEQYSPYKV